MYQLLIGSKGTLDVWDLLLSSFKVGDASPKTNYVDIPGGDGSIDLTEALTGEVAYDNRVITAKFTIMPPRSNWEALMDTIRAYCHGRKYHIQVPQDADHYYIGRVSVGSLEISGETGIFEMTIACDPYKYKAAITTQTFTIGAAGHLDVVLINARKRVIPTVVLSHSTTILFKGVSTVLSPGTYLATSMVLIEGNNPVILTAAVGATITISYQEGSL